MNIQTLPDHKSIVAKSNELIGQMAKFELSELRLIAFCLAHYDSRKPDNRLFRAHVSDLTALFPIDQSNAYRVVRQAMLGINKKPLEFEKDNKEYFWNWFSGFVYDRTTGEFEFKITPEIQPYLLSLEGNFTPYRLGDVYQFKAASTWKMYELLKRWLTSGKWQVSLDELRLLLGVAGKYPKWSELQRRIIDSSLQEINETSDIRVKYLQIKRGRKVTGLEFQISEKPDQFTVELETEQQELHKTLVGAGISPKTSLNLIEKANRLDKTSVLVNKVPSMVENATKKGANKAKYITGAINLELDQLGLFEDEEQPQKVMGHEESLECWQSKKKNDEQCPVRVRGEAGQRKKCKICLEKIPVEDFGI